MHIFPPFFNSAKYVDTNSIASQSISPSVAAAAAAAAFAAAAAVQPNRHSHAPTDMVTNPQSKTL